MNNVTIPSKNELESVLEKLISESSKEERDRIAIWVFELYDILDIKIENPIVVKTLDRLSGIDLINPCDDSESGFLYNTIDFEIWLKELNE
ncbi:hypothetical protein FACS1894192_09390 [Bacilli bacterium]|nr:hypothetical protein FACS1894192_09390 [Bacilli bacterium]